MNRTTLQVTLEHVHITITIYLSPPTFPGRNRIECSAKIWDESLYSDEESIGPPPFLPEFEVGGRGFFKPFTDYLYDRYSALGLFDCDARSGYASVVLFSPAGIYSTQLHLSAKFGLINGSSGYWMRSLPENEGTYKCLVINEKGYFESRTGEIKIRKGDIPRFHLQWNNIATFEKNSEYDGIRIGRFYEEEERKYVTDQFDSPLRMTDIIPLHDYKFEAATEQLEENRVYWYGYSSSNAIAYFRTHSVFPTDRLFQFIGAEMSLASAMLTFSYPWITERIFTDKRRKDRIGVLVRAHNLAATHERNQFRIFDEDELICCSEGCTNKMDCFKVNFTGLYPGTEFNFTLNLVYRGSYNGGTFGPFRTRSMHFVPINRFTFSVTENSVTFDWQSPLPSDRFTNFTVTFSGRELTYERPLTISGLEPNTTYTIGVAHKLLGSIPWLGVQMNYEPQVYKIRTLPRPSARDQIIEKEDYDVLAAMIQDEIDDIDRQTRVLKEKYEYLLANEKYEERTLEVDDLEKQENIIAELMQMEANATATVKELAAVDTRSGAKTLAILMFTVLIIVMGFALFATRIEHKTNTLAIQRTMRSSRSTRAVSDVSSTPSGATPFSTSKETKVKQP
ncbi:hypothetical protein Q1695_005426 [Nippostrongylus brasiliensis]|nr:hypothetical protein Q1695_005426 [Nippostrongylus brasiliensis]